VEVARTAGVLGGVSPAACAQELNIKRIDRTSVIFLIMLFSEELNVGRDAIPPYGLAKSTV
jgi:hypothetical protein